MKRKMIFLLVLGVLNTHAEFSKLEALSMIESGDNDRAVGKAGEVSRYQLMPKTWRHYTDSAAYSNPAFARQIATKHLAGLEATFRAQTGRQPSDFDCYVLWNAGPSYYARVGFNSARVHPIIRDRAERYVNLRQMTAPMLAFDRMR